MLEYDPQVNLVHYPVPMRRFGLNPFNEPLYRIVATQSRRHLVGGCWPDGDVGYHWVPRYRQIKSAWILEAWDWPKISQREWDNLRDPISGFPVLGPYPTRGEYDLAFEFDMGVSAESLDTLVGAIEKGRKRSFQDVRDSHMKEYEAEEKEWKQAARDEVREAVTAFGVAPISSLSGVARGTKNTPELRSAQELGLPIPRSGPRINRTIGPRRTFDVRDAQVTSSLIAGR